MPKSNLPVADDRLNKLYLITNTQKNRRYSGGSCLLSFDHYSKHDTPCLDLVYLITHRNKLIFFMKVQ